jgi:hypothetical protein
MAEAYQRIHGDRTPYGYRQLAGTGPGSGPELKTLVVAGLGAALGIVVATLLASGPLNGTNRTAALHPVQSGPVASVTTSPSAVKAAPAAPVKSQAVQQESAQNSAAQVAQKSTQNSVTQIAQKSTQNSVAQIAQKSTQNSVTQNATQVKPQAVHRVSVAHKHHSARWLAARRKYLAWRRTHPRHRLPTQLVAISVATPSSVNPLEVEPPQPDDAAKFFAYTVEGDVTLANYNAVTRTLDTYEGETFLLAQAGSENDANLLQDYPPNVHYRCDQSGNCSLVKSGLAFINSTRIK